MASETVRIACPPGVYTLLATAPVALSLKVNTNKKTTRGRLSLAAAQPVPSATTYIEVNDRNWVNLNNLSGVNAYFMPNDDAVTLEVVRT